MFRGAYSDVLADANVDAVVLATPAVMHFEMARQAIEAGKDVYVEKPLALNVEEGAELVRLAERSGRIMMVGHILQYHPAVRKLKELIVAGELGRIDYIYSNRLNMGKIRTEENILWSFAPHDISVVLSLLDEEPVSVTSDGGEYLNRGVADVTLSQLTFASGVRAHIFVSWLHPFKEQRLVVVGSEKMAVFDDTAADKLVLYPHRVEWKDRVPSAVKAVGRAGGTGKRGAAERRVPALSGMPGDTRHAQDGCARRAACAEGAGRMRRGSYCASRDSSWKTRKRRRAKNTLCIPRR